MFSNHWSDSWKLISKIGGVAIKFLREDLRKGGAAAIELSLINGTSSHLGQEKPAQFPSKNEKKDRKIEEAVSPSQMR